jgi:tRNA A-37 threonylcarbamoyl transferase component Bud32
MLANLPIPNLTRGRASLELVEMPYAAGGATVILHPRFASWLRKAGLDSAPAILALRGEVVCGHADRHVVKVKLPNGRTLFLKREHVVGWQVRFKNWRAGFGSISRCEREAILLQLLEETGLPAPQWLAYGTTSDGQAFLLVDNLAGASDLLALSLDQSLTLNDRLLIASRAGSSVAEYHDAGFGTPDLSAKHLFAAAPAYAMTVIDWQSAPMPGPVAWTDRVAMLARLDASLPDATPRERLAFLRSYLRACQTPVPRFKDLARRVAALSSRRRQRRGTASLVGPSVRLVWLDGERAVSISEIASHWPAAMHESEPGQHTRARHFDPLGRLFAFLRGTVWQSPAAQSARTLVHLQHSGIPAPRLLAYGQTPGPMAMATSFLLTDLPPDAEPVASNLPDSGARRRTMLRLCGTLLRMLHVAGFVLKSSASPSFFVERNGRLFVNAPTSVERKKRPGTIDLLLDLRKLLRELGPSLTRTDRARIVKAYYRSKTPNGFTRRVIARWCRGGAV